MLFPVQGSTQLLSQYAGKSVIQNQGPGNLYLYRNSAVSMAAYDVFLAPGGSAGWPGGELWAATDQANTIANVLNADAQIDSGSVAVSGGSLAVSSIGTPINNVQTDISPIRSVRSVQSQDRTISVQTPLNCAAGDVIVWASVYKVSNDIYNAGQSGMTVSQSGWSSQFSGFNFDYDANSKSWYVLYSRIATAADEGGKMTYTFGVRGSDVLLPYPAGLLMALRGAASPVASSAVFQIRSTSTTATAKGSLTIPQYSNAVFMSTVGAYNQLPRPTVPVWAAPANGGPPTPAPAWIGDSSHNPTSRLTLGLWAATAPNPPGAYNVDMYDIVTTSPAVGWTHTAVRIV